MALLFWDASSLVKRYTAEAGRDTVNAIFAVASLKEMATTPWGYAETYSILLRRHNAGLLDRSAFVAAADQLRIEVADSPDFGMLDITNEAIFASLAVMDKHNLNATDAAILAMLLNLLPSPVPPDFLLITADKRLLRAAAKEGMKVLDPADLSAADVPALLAAL